MSDMAPLSGTVGDNSLSERARRHLWMHFTRLGAYGAHHEVPVMVRGEGAYVWDQTGKRYLDGLSGLFTSQLGHGRTELAEAASVAAAALGLQAWGGDAVLSGGRFAIIDFNDWPSYSQVRAPAARAIARRAMRLIRRTR